MPRPCVNLHPYSPHLCARCRLVRDRPDYRELWGEADPSPAPASPAPPAATPLVHCPECPGNVRVKVFDGMTATALLKILPGPVPPGGWPAGWETWESTHAAHASLFDHAARSDHPYPEGKYDGKGVVVSGGGAVYFTATWVMIHVLRALGCTLPVEWWYVGDEEMDPVMRRLAESVAGVTTVDAKKIDVPKPRILNGWESKVFSIQHSRFAEVLYLDADQVPAINPTFLFSDPHYLHAGAVFWPDLANQWGYDVTEQAFKTAGLPVPGRSRMPSHNRPSDYRPFESGQVLVDKARCWKALALTAHICDHSDYWFGQPAGQRVWWIYGDKSAFFLGFERAGQPYAMPKDCTWSGDSQGQSGAFIQYDFSGRPVFQHRCQPASKWSLHGENHRTPGLAHFDICLRALASLRDQWVGHPWHYGHQDGPDNTVAAALAGRHFVLGVDEEECSLTLSEGGGAILEPGNSMPKWQIDRWTVRHIDGKPMLALANVRKGVLFLGPGDDGCWVGALGLWMLDVLPEGWQAATRFDRVIFQSVVRANEYDLPERFGPDEVVVDIGGHQGSFAYAALQRGAARVLVVEPNPENLVRLYNNLAPLAQRVAIYPVAAWRCDVPVALLGMSFPEGALHHGGGCTTDRPAGGEERTFVGVPLDAFLSVAAGALAGRGTGRIAVLKLDCEGAEFPCLFTSALLHLVDRIVGEYHLGALSRMDDAARIDGRPYSRDALQACLQSKGFTVSFRQHKEAEGLGHFDAVRIQPGWLGAYDREPL